VGLCCSRLWAHSQGLIDLQQALHQAWCMAQADCTQKQLQTWCFGPFHTPRCAAPAAWSRSGALGGHIHPNQLCRNLLACVLCVLCQALVGSAGVPTVGNVLPQAFKVSVGS
jgi:hypothetical protein